LHPIKGVLVFAKGNKKMYILLYDFIIAGQGDLLKQLNSWLSINYTKTKINILGKPKSSNSYAVLVLGSLIKGNILIE
jgi:hypothetical protein